MLSRSIDLDLVRQLQDREFRAGFFQAEIEHGLPEQIKSLRKLRDMTQGDLAKALDTSQPAIVRMERSDYGRWNIKTLLKVAEAVDARLVITLEPSEAFLERFSQEEAGATAGKSSSATESRGGQTTEPQGGRPALRSIDDARDRALRPQELDPVDVRQHAR